MIDWAVMVMEIPTANAARIAWNLSESTAGAGIQFHPPRVLFVSQVENFSSYDWAMNRSDLIDELAAHFVNLTKNDTEFAVNTLLDALQDALVAGHHIEIRGFGSFSVSHRAARVGRNPRNGESVAVPEKRTIRFKPGKALRETVDK